VNRDRDIPERRCALNGITLSSLPLSAMVFCALYLIGIGCEAIAAFTQASTQEIDIGQMSQTAKVWIRTPLPRGSSCPSA
jgi:hypothetical protein